MAGYWVLAGSTLLLPIAVLLIGRPYETRAQELERIAERR